MAVCHIVHPSAFAVPFPGACTFTHKCIYIYTHVHSHTPTYCLCGHLRPNILVLQLFKLQTWWQTGCQDDKLRVKELQLRFSYVIFYIRDVVLRKHEYKYVLYHIWAFLKSVSMWRLSAQNSSDYTTIEKGSVSAWPENMEDRCSIMLSNLPGIWGDASFSTELEQMGQNWWAFKSVTVFCLWSEWKLHVAQCQTATMSAKCAFYTKLKHELADK